MEKEEDIMILVKNGIFLYGENVEKFFIKSC